MGLSGLEASRAVRRSESGLFRLPLHTCHQVAGDLWAVIMPKPAAGQLPSRHPYHLVSSGMTLAEQVARLRELAGMSTETRMLDVLIIDILDALTEAVGRLERHEPPGPGSL